MSYRVPILGPVWQALLARLGLAATTAEQRADAASQSADAAADAAEQAAASATTATTKAAAANTSAGAAAGSATAASEWATTASGHAQTASESATQASQDAAAAAASATTATTKAAAANTSAGAANTSAQNAATTVITAAAQAVADAQAAVASLRAPSRVFYADAAYAASTDGLTFGDAATAINAALGELDTGGATGRYLVRLYHTGLGEPMVIPAPHTRASLAALGVDVVTAGGSCLSVDDQLLLGLIAGRDVDLNHAQILDLGVLRITLDLNP